MATDVGARLISTLTRTYEDYKDHQTRVIVQELGAGAGCWSG